MYLNSKINTIEDFEKYSFLLNLDNKSLTKLEDVIRTYQDYQKESFIFEEKYSEFVRDFNRLLENNSLKDANTKEEIFLIEDLINKEIIKNKKYLNYLKYMLNDNSIFVIDTFKDNLDKGKILRQEFIEKLKTNKNKDKIDNIIKKIDELDKSIFNKEEKTKRIILLERQIINEVELIINKLCFIFNVEYKNRNIKSKYMLITDLLIHKNKAYNVLKENFIVKLDLLDSIDELKLDLDIEDIKKISEDGISFLLERLRLYEMHKKDNRVHVGFMVR